LVTMLPAQTHLTSGSPMGRLRLEKVGTPLRGIRGQFGETAILESADCRFCPAFAEPARPRLGSRSSNTWKTSASIRGRGSRI